MTRHHAGKSLTPRHMWIFLELLSAAGDSIHDERVPIGREVKPMVPTTAAFTGELVPWCKNVHVIVV